MYWNTRSQLNCSGYSSSSHWLRLSSIAGPFDQGLHHPLHAHEARALDQHRGHGRRAAQRRQQRLDRAELARTATEAIGRGRMRAQRARGPELFDAALAGVRADLGVELPGLACRPRPCRPAPASAERSAWPARRWPRAPNPGWRCSCRRPASARALPRFRRCRCERPFTGSKASRPRTTCVSATPAASAQALAASAFFRLCCPAMRSSDLRRAGAGVQLQRPVVALPCGIGAHIGFALQREGPTPRAHRPVAATAA